MSDSESELTDLSDDNSDYPSSKAKPNIKGKSRDGTYRIQNALKVPRATTYTAQALYDQIINGDVELEPEYQRDVVWPESKQVGIIDSLLRNFYIPPVIFAVKPLDDGTESRTCIDGKQRLTSIYRFMDGMIAHKDPFTGEKLWYKDDGSKTSRGKKILPEKYKKVFANKQVVCVEYTDINDADEREIFQRVQLGMALTPAEKLHAIKSPRADFIRKIQRIYFDGDGPLNSEHMEWEKSRGGGFRCLSQAVLLLNTNAATLGLTGVEKFLKDPAPLANAMRDSWDSTFYTFGRLVADSTSLKGKNNVFKHPTKPAPIEIIAITYLIGRHQDKLTLNQLTTAIGNLRTTLRGEHADIRMNSRVWKTAYEFVTNLKASKHGPASGQPPAATAMANLGPSPLVKDEGRDKRKRSKDQSDDEERDQPPTKSVKNSSTTTPSQPNHVMTLSTSVSSPAPPRTSAMQERLAALRTSKHSTASLALPPITTAPVYSQPPPLSTTSQAISSPVVTTPVAGQGIPIPLPTPNAMRNPSTLETSFLGWGGTHPPQPPPPQSYPSQSPNVNYYGDRGDSGYRSRDPREGRTPYRDDYRDTGPRTRDRDRDERGAYKPSGHYRR